MFKFTYPIFNNYFQKLLYLTHNSEQPNNSLKFLKKSIKEPNKNFKKFKIVEEERKKR